MQIRLLYRKEEKEKWERNQKVSHIIFVKWNVNVTLRKTNNLINTIIIMYQSISHFVIYSLFNDMKLIEFNIWFRRDFTTHYFTKGKRYFRWTKRRSCIPFVKHSWAAKLYNRQLPFFAWMNTNAITQKLEYIYKSYKHDIMSVFIWWKHWIVHSLDLRIGYSLYIIRLFQKW